ncbi:MAG: hypothetical protein GY794_09555 [bacterium]|nr:hypothetical protein [bacterium]
MQDQEAQKRLMDAGADIVADDNNTRKVFTRIAELRTVNLLAVFKHPVGAAVEYNPGILCIAEQIRHMPGMTRGKDYHFHTKKFLQTGQLEVSFPKEIYTEQVGGVSFDVMPMEISVAGVTVKQKQYAAIMKGYALLIIVSYAGDEGEKALADVMNTIVFE